MAKLDTFQLRKTIPQEEFDYLLLKGALSDYAAVRQKINELLKSGVIVRIKKGLYVFGPEYNFAPICKEVLANLIYGPSCISMEFALAFHGVIPERVQTVTSVTPKRDKAFDTPLGKFSYRYLSNKKYSHGIEQVWIDEKRPVFMASLEKALIDCVTLNKVPLFSDADAANRFLQSDLRMKKEDLTRIDTHSLWKLNRIYRSPNIDRILEAL